MTSNRTFRLLLFTRESFPTFRVDIEKLFGKELIGRHHAIDFVMQASSADTKAGPIPWRGQTIWVAAPATLPAPFRRIERPVRAFMHDIHCLLRLARPERYDAIQVRNKFLVGAIACIVARKRGVKFIYWLSFPYPEAQISSARDGTARFPTINRLRGTIFGWLLYYIILPRSDHVFVQSQRMKEDLALKGCDPKKMTPIPMGVDPDDFPVKRLYSKAGGCSDRTSFVLGYLGTLGAQRRLEILIESLAILCSCGANARLLLVGGSENPLGIEVLERRAHELGVARRIEITGLLPRQQALERIQEADVALSPFFPTMILLSTSPTKLVEYLALGLPVVANWHPEQRLILRQSRAGVCVPWGARHFARGARWLAQAGRSRRIEIGARGRQWVLANRTYGEISGVVEGKYRELLSS